MKEFDEQNTMKFEAMEAPDRGAPTGDAGLVQGCLWRG